MDIETLAKDIERHNKKIREFYAKVNEAERNSDLRLLNMQVKVAEALIKENIGLQQKLKSIGAKDSRFKLEVLEPRKIDKMLSDIDYQIRESFSIRSERLKRRAA